MGHIKNITALQNTTSAGITNITNIDERSISLDFFGGNDSRGGSNLTDTQEKVLAVLPFFPAILSIWGSITTIRLVLASAGGKKRSTYRRLLLGLSICDLLTCLYLPFTSFFVPQNISGDHRVWAIGTDTTCTVLGFLAQFASSGLLYSACLSFYFLLTIRYSLPPDDVAARIEPWMHGISLGFPIVTASLGVVLGIYKELSLGPGCWIANDNAKNLALLFGGVPFIFLLQSLVINNTLIYQHVKNTISQTIGRQSKTLRRKSTNLSERAFSKASAMEKDESLKPVSSSFIMDDSSSSHNDDSFRVESLSSSSSMTIISKGQMDRINAVRNQALVYIAVFILTYSWTLMLRIMEAHSFSNNEKSVYWLLMMQAIFLPMQGFLNLLVYVRPSVIRLQREFPEQPFWWIFGQATSPVGAAEHSSSTSFSSIFRRSTTGLSMFSLDRSQHSTAGGGGL